MYLLIVHIQIMYSYMGVHCIIQEHTGSLSCTQYTYPSQPQPCVCECVYSGSAFSLCVSLPPTSSSGGSVDQMCVIYGEAEAAVREASNMLNIISHRWSCVAPSATHTHQEFDTSLSSLPVMLFFACVWAGHFARLQIPSHPALTSLHGHAA